MFKVNLYTLTVNKEYLRLSINSAARPKWLLRTKSLVFEILNVEHELIKITRSYDLYEILPSKCASWFEQFRFCIGSEQPLEIKHCTNIVFEDIFLF